MKRLYKYILPAFIGLGLFSSCDDQLEQVPNKQSDIIPTKIEYLNGFFSSTYNSQIVDINQLLTLSDDYEPLKVFEQKKSRAYSNGHLQLPVTWKMYSIANMEYKKGPWDGEFNKIFLANTILDYLPEVSGSDSEKKHTEGDAYMMRANAYFNLLNYYCLPYVKGGSNDHLGLPIRTNTSLEDFSPRATLKECYDLMLGDLRTSEALLADIDLKTAPIGTARQWRGSAPAVYSLLANVHLAMGNFTKAQEYADKALSNLGVARLVDFNTEVSYTSSGKYTIQEEEGVPIDVEVYTSNLREVSFSPYDWQETFWRSSTSFPGGEAWLVPSAELMNLYGDSEDSRRYDLRWKYMFTENFSYGNPAYQGGGDPFVPALKIPGYAGIHADENQSYHINLGPTVAEMYLVKAECLARAGEYGSAQSLVNKLRAKRMDKSAPADVINLTFTKENAVKQILDERRREMPFVKRWFDIRRLAANNETAYLPTNIVRKFYAVDEVSVDVTTEVTYTFNPIADYKKLAFPIPKSEIIEVAVFGVDLKQNEYDAE